MKIFDNKAIKLAIAFTVGILIVVLVGVVYKEPILDFLGSVINKLTGKDDQDIVVYAIML